MSALRAVARARSKRDEAARAFLAALLTAWQDGYSLRQIAKAARMNHSAVDKHLKRLREEKP